MFPAQFDYYRAASVQEALGLLKRHGDAKLLAGGHSLIPMMKLRLSQPSAVIDIGRIQELSGIRVVGAGRIHIGALTTHATLAASDLLRSRCQVLGAAASQIADPSVRNKGTIGGNIAHADPGSDLPAVLVALDATVHITGAKGDRQVAARSFFVDLLATDLKEGEILTHVEVPAFEGKSGSAYLKFEHPASGYAVCGAAAVVKLDAAGKCTGADLAFNGVTATPHHAKAVGEALRGKALDDAAIDQAIDSKLSIADPLGDLFASGPYRIEIAKVYGKRALKLARDRAQHG
jgi:aerobic carbon-monoxide dehydrogenase medium subunit